MNSLHDKSIHENIFEPKVGQLGLACSNKKSCSCPSFGFNNSSEDISLDYLAKILVEIYLDKKEQ